MCMAVIIGENRNMEIITTIHYLHVITAAACTYRMEKMTFNYHLEGARCMSTQTATLLPDTVYTADSMQCSTYIQINRPSVQHSRHHLSYCLGFLYCEYIYIYIEREREREREREI